MASHFANGWTVGKNNTTALAWDQSCRMFLYSREAMRIHLPCKLITRQSKRVFVMTDESSFPPRKPTIKEIGEDGDAALKREDSNAAGRWRDGEW